MCLSTSRQTNGRSCRLCLCVFVRVHVCIHYQNIVYTTELISLEKLFEESTWFKAVATANWRLLVRKDKFTKTMSDKMTDLQHTLQNNNII